MTTITSPELRAMSESEVRNAAVSFVGRLDAGETLTGTPTVTEVDANGNTVSPANLTFSNVGVNTAALTINGLSVAIGQAVQFNVTAGAGLDGDYNINVKCGTNASPAQTLIVKCKLRVLSD